MLSRLDSSAVGVFAPDRVAYLVGIRTTCPGEFLLYLGTASPGALSHFLTVLRDSPVSFAMALVESLSRSFMRLTLPIISMVITLLYLLKFSAGQWNTLVNFGAALLALSGQFSVGVNTTLIARNTDLALFKVRLNCWTYHVAPSTRYFYNQSACP
jgi:hypothetical protein